MKESSKKEQAFLQKVYQEVKAKCPIDEPVQAKNQEEGGSEDAKADDQEGIEE